VASAANGEADVRWTRKDDRIRLMANYEVYLRRRKADESVDSRKTRYGNYKRWCPSMSSSSRKRLFCKPVSKKRLDASRPIFPKEYTMWKLYAQRRCTNLIIPRKYVMNNNRALLSTGALVLEQRFVKMLREELSGWREKFDGEDLVGMAFCRGRSTRKS